MKCLICKTNEAKSGSILCSDKCDKIMTEIHRMADKYTPTNGCDNCWGDLHQGCTEQCKEEFNQSSQFVLELYSLVRIALNK